MNKMPKKKSHTVRRLLSYVGRGYLIRFFLVLVCILVSAVASVAGSIFLGALCALAYNRLMVTISQGVQKKIRDDLFGHMQTLPIRYFDTHAHGDVMSVYTNDVDTLRQMLSQSIPQVINSLMMIVVTFVSMVVLNLTLTGVVIVCIVCMLLVTRFLAGRSGRYFVRQQVKLGDLNG